MNLDIDRIYDKIETKFFNFGLEALNTDEVVIFAVATFFGQMRDGGLVSVFADPWINLVPLIPPALRSIGADEYAGIADQMLNCAVEIVESNCHDTLEALEEPFWKRFNNVEVGDMMVIDGQLFQYAKQNRLI